MNFLALSRKRTVQHKEPPSIEPSSITRNASSKGSESTASDEEDWFPGSKRRLDFGVKRVEANRPGGTKPSFCLEKCFQENECKAKKF
jgi:hypothetical protein